MEKDSLGDLVIVDFYAGPYGPTIRIDIPSDALLLQVTDIFRHLVRNDRLEVDLLAFRFVVASGLRSLVLRTDDGLTKKFEAKTLKLCSKRQQPPSFAWTRAREGWTECLEKMEILRRPGHQYLTIEGLDDALVEASFGESSPMTRARILDLRSKEGLEHL